MAKRELLRSSLTMKPPPKYFSSLNAGDRPKEKRLLIDVPEGAHIPPKDSTRVVRKSAEDVLQALKVLTPKSTRSYSKGSIDSPKLRPTVQLLGQRSNSGTLYPSIERPRSSLNSPKPVPLLVSHKSTPKALPHTHKYSYSGSFTPKSQPVQQESRPITAAAHKPIVTGLEKTGKQALLGTMVTQVKGIRLEKGRNGEQTAEEIKAKTDAIYNDHLFQTFQALKFAKTLPQPDTSQIVSKRVYLPRRPGYEQKKTIIFDLDETLVHCCEDQTTANADVYLPVVFPNGEVVQAGINIRPYVKECLTAANRDFEVIVFTASHRCYADVVLNHLDPGNQLIHHRLYRDNCVQVNGVFFKDLRVINRSLADLVIVDNAAYSFAFQLDNGIPIISWRDDRNDQELFNLIDYMKSLSEERDCRLLNARTFHLSTFCEDYMKEFMSPAQKSAVKTTRLVSKTRISI